MINGGNFAQQSHHHIWWQSVCVCVCVMTECGCADHAGTMSAVFLNAHALTQAITNEIFSETEMK